MIAPLYLLEETVGTLLLTIEHAIEAHPLGSCQWGGFHVFGAFDDGNIDVLQSAIASGILEGREEDGIGLCVDDLLDDRAHAVAAVYESSLLHTLLHERHFDILQVGHAGHLLFGLQLADKSTVHTGEHNAAAEGSAHNGTFR